jgi:hypothetical protein
MKAEIFIQSLEEGGWHLVPGHGRKHIPGKVNSLREGKESSMLGTIVS